MVTTDRLEKLHSQAKFHLKKSDAAPLPVRENLREQIEILEELIESRKAAGK